MSNSYTGANIKPAPGLTHTSQTAPTKIFTALPQWSFIAITLLLIYYFTDSHNFSLSDKKKKNPSQIIQYNFI